MMFLLPLLLPFPLARVALKNLLTASPPTALDAVLSLYVTQ